MTKQLGEETVHGVPNKVPEWLKPVKKEESKNPKDKG